MTYAVFVIICVVLTVGGVLFIVAKRLMEDVEHDHLQRLMDTLMCRRCRHHIAAHLHPKGDAPSLLLPAVPHVGALFSSPCDVCGKPVGAHECP